MQCDGGDFSPNLLSLQKLLSGKSVSDVHYVCEVCEICVVSRQVQGTIFSRVRDSHDRRY